MIRTALAAICGILVTLLFTLLAIGVSLPKKGGNLPHLVGKLWARTILFVSRTRVCVQGLHNISPLGTYVYMANHQSMYDILALLGYLPVQFRWLAKMELFQIPIFGYSMARAGHISIDRSDRKSAHKSLQEAAHKIAHGVSVVIFPEGTRSSDGRINQFKPGGFYLAISSGQPIVPVVIYGSRHVLRKGSLRIRPGPIVVSINAPIDTSSYNNSGKRVLMESVRSIMKQDLEKIAAKMSC